jgi:hypothetical protein
METKSREIKLTPEELKLLDDAKVPKGSQRDWVLEVKKATLDWSFTRDQTTPFLGFNCFEVLKMHLMYRRDLYKGPHFLASDTREAIKRNYRLVPRMLEKLKNMSEADRKHRYFVSYVHRMIGENIEKSDFEGQFIQITKTMNLMHHGISFVYDMFFGFPKYKNADDGVNLFLDKLNNLGVKADYFDSWHL